MSDDDHMTDQHGGYLTASDVRAAMDARKPVYVQLPDLGPCRYDRSHDLWRNTDGQPVITAELLAHLHPELVPPDPDILARHLPPGEALRIVRDPWPAMP